jgi:hypothetical protein
VPVNYGRLKLIKEIVLFNLISIYLRMTLHLALELQSLILFYSQKNNPPNPTPFSYVLALETILRIVM